MYWRLYMDLKEEASASLALQSERLDLEMDKRLISERKAAELEAKALASTKAIEASSLPWYPKNDQMEARFEADEMDKMNNPQVSWDTIPGLGSVN